MSDKNQKAIEHGNYSCGLFLDLSKVFDTVNHTILLNKLEHYGIRGFNFFFQSYLGNRRQFAFVGGTASSERTTSCGVPQGSVLGPLLLLLYINDIKTVLIFLAFIFC